MWQNDIRDKLTALEAEVRYSLDESNEHYAHLQRDPRSTLRPVLNLNLPPAATDVIHIHKNCGPDNVCVPNLVLNYTS